MSSRSPRPGPELGGPHEAIRGRPCLFRDLLAREHAGDLLPAAQDRREEIARMLSGEQVTEEARAAADRLMGAA